MISKLKEQGIDEGLLTLENIQMCCNIFINDDIDRIYDAIGETYSISLYDLKQRIRIAEAISLSKVKSQYDFSEYGELGEQLKNSLANDFDSIRQQVLTQGLSELIDEISIVALEEEFPVYLFRPKTRCFLSNGTDRRTGSPRYTAVLYAETNSTKEELENLQLIRKNYAIEQFLEKL